MQQIGLQTSGSYVWANKMTAMERSARGIKHSSGSGFTLPETNNDNNKSHIVSKATHTNRANLASAQTSISNVTAEEVVNPLLSIAGGAIMGGPVGALTAAAGELFEIVSGDSFLGHVASLFTDTAPAATTLAKANRAYAKAGGLTATPQ